MIPLLLALLLAQGTGFLAPWYVGGEPADDGKCLMFSSLNDYASWNTCPAGVSDHGALTGLADDDHTQYLLLAGRASGQTVTQDTITTGSGVALSVDGLTTGVGLDVQSTSVATTTAVVADVDHTATVTASYQDTGNVARVSRAMTSNFANTTLFSDNFTPAGNPLSGTTPDVGTGWTRLVSNAGCDAKAVNDGYGNWVGPTVYDPPTASAGVLYRAVDGVSVNDYEVSILIDYPGYGDDYTGLAARVTDANNYIYFQFVGFSSLGGNAELWKRVGGSATKLATIATPATYGTVRLRVVGTTVTVLYGSTVMMQATVSDAALQTGDAGLGFGYVVTSTADTYAYTRMKTFLVTQLDHYIEGPAMLVSSNQAATSGAWSDQAPVLQVDQLSTAAVGDAFVVRNAGLGQALKVYASGAIENPAYVISAEGYMGLGLSDPGSRFVLYGTQLISDGYKKATSTGVDGVEVIKSEADVQGFSAHNSTYGYRVLLGATGGFSTDGPYVWADPFYDNAKGLRFVWGGSYPNNPNAAPFDTYCYPAVSGNTCGEVFRIDGAGMLVNRIARPWVDFVAQGDNATKLFVVDASADTVEIGTTVQGAIAMFGASAVTLKQDTTISGGSDLRFLDPSDSTGYVGFQAPSGFATTLAWTLPSADGSANQLLRTDGAGVLVWTSNAPTATALAANGANCAAGEVPLGVDASGAAEGCADAGGLACDDMIPIGQLLAAATLSTPATAEVLYFSWPGSSAYSCASLTHSIKGNLYRTAGAGDCQWRIKDITNTTTLCTSAAVTTATTTNIVDCGAVSNVPSGAAQMAIEFVVTGTATCASKSGGFWLVKG